MKRLNNKSVHKLTYGEFLKPFVPQWNGDVRVLQSTMHSQIVKGSRKETNPIADGIMFGLNSPSGQKLKLSDIHLLTPHSVPSDVNSLILQNILSAFTMSQKKWRYRELPVFYQDTICSIQRRPIFVVNC